MVSLRGRTVGPLVRSTGRLPRIGAVVVAAVRAVVVVSGVFADGTTAVYGGAVDAPGGGASAGRSLRVSMSKPFSLRNDS